MILEVLDHAPTELSPPERLLLVALAETARDDTRMCWPGMETLTRRTGLSARRVREVLAELAQRGYEVRVPSGVDRHGMPVFASKGHRTVYRVPAFRQRGTDTAASKEAEVRPLSGTQRRQNSASFGSAKAAESGTQRRRNPVAKAAESRPPSPHEPSREPSNTRASDPSRNGRPQPAAWLDGAVDFVTERLTATTGRTYDRRNITDSVTGFLSGKTVSNPGAYVRKSADKNPLQFEPTPMPERYQPEEKRTSHDH